MNAVLCGIDRIGQYDRLFAGRKIALATGASGVTRDLGTSIDRFRERYDLKLILAPEHGARGELQPGARVDDALDASGVPCVSLFGGGFNEEAGAAAAARAIRDIDVVAFDIQDAGSRYFTYASTLFMLQKACAAAGKPLVVLDRPNPLGGARLEGNSSRDANLSFIGRTRVPIRHGFTMGELARFQNARYRLGCDLTVIPLAGWRRGMYLDETGLCFTPPSPNLPSMNALLCYNGTCLFSGTNVSEGRGTTEPFTLVGAPYIDPARWTRALNGAGLPGVRFQEAHFLPQFSKYAGTVCGGARLHVTDRDSFCAVDTGVWMLCLARAMYPKDFAFRAPDAGGRWHIDIASGTDDLRIGFLDARAICDMWRAEAEAFEPTHREFMLYGEDTI